MEERMAGVTARLSSLLPSLSGALYDVGAFVVANPKRVVRMSTRNVAEETGTSDAAVVRLSQRLGLRGYRDLQINLAFDLGDGSQTAHAEEEITGDDDLQLVAERVCRAGMASLAQSWQVLDSEAMERAVRFLHEARRVSIYAQGANFGTGADFQYNLSKLGIPTGLFSDPYMQMINATSGRPGHVSVGISQNGENRDIIEALTASGQNGAATIALTCHTASPITRIADITLATPPREFVFRGEPMSSRLSLLYLVDVLFIGVALAKGEAGRRRLGRVQRDLEARRHPASSGKGVRGAP